MPSFGGVAVATIADANAEACSALTMRTYSAAPLDNWALSTASVKGTYVSPLCPFTKWFDCHFTETSPSFLSAAPKASGFGVTGVVAGCAPGAGTGTPVSASSAVSTSVTRA